MAATHWFHRNWRIILAWIVMFLATLLAAWYVSAKRADATTVQVTQSAKCVNADQHRFDVTVSAHNTYSTTLHVKVNNPASPIDLTLAPNQVWTYTFHVTDGPWKVTFTTSDAELKGDVSKTWTLLDVCGVPPTTTTPPTTTCSQAIPPRNDCGTVVTTNPAPVVTTTLPAPTLPPTSVAVTSAPPPASTSPATGGGAAQPVTTSQHITLPVTGVPAWTLFWIALVLIFIGFVLAAIYHVYWHYKDIENGDD